MARLSRRRILGDPINCTSGKTSFLTEDEAAAQLARARTIRAEAGSRLPGRVEARYYDCHAGGTLHYHLTAEGEPPRGLRRASRTNRRKGK